MSYAPVSFFSISSFIRFEMCDTVSSSGSGIQQLWMWLKWYLARFQKPRVHKARGLFYNFSDLWQIYRKTHLSKIRVCLGENITALAHPNETPWCKTIYAIGTTFLRNMCFKKSRSQHENQLDNFALPWGEFAKFSGSKKLQGSRKNFAWVTNWCDSFILIKLL